MSKKLSVRSMLVAPKGKTLISVDLSQAESWIVAYLSQDQNMQYSLNFSDIHTDSGFALFEEENYCNHTWQEMEDGSRVCMNCEVRIVKTQRYIGKRYNHASSYRMKPPRAAQVINKDSDKPPFVTVTIQESTVFSERWHRRYNVKNWWAEIDNKLYRDRKLITTYGRERTFFGNLDDNVKREATAFEPQSTVADHFNGAIHPELNIPGGLREIKRKLINNYEDRAIVNQSHDSCIVEVPAKDAKDTAFEMMNLLKRPLVIKGVKFTIPVDGEIGERWGEMEKIKNE